MSWFRRHPQNAVRNPGNAAAFLANAGEYWLAHERQIMPDPGAEAFSWETLDLVKFNIVNSGWGQNRYQRITNRPLYTGNAAPVTGIPTIGATLFLQPLVNTA